ncbi:hypothetical protein ACOSQ4_009283 [Xanthoceras sorbifolium]
MIVCWLLSTLSPPIFGQVVSHCITAFELWNCITQIFAQNSLAWVLNLRAHLQNLKKGSMSVTEYIVKIKGLADMLKAARQIYPMLLQIMRRIQMGDLPPNFKINQFQQPFRDKFRGRGRGRSGRFYNSRALCQLCGKLGHNATVCYHRYDQTEQTHFNRFDQSAHGHNRFNNSSPHSNIAQQLNYSHDPVYAAYQPHNSYNTMIASSSTIVDPSWYVDSGQTAKENTSTRGSERWTLPAHSPKSLRFSIKQSSRVQLSHDKATYSLCI